ncbi:MAG: helix-turn-helix domain-containing protein [Chloroflexia bacterium]|nr:helix-turn-helix domain-containing protein [Chloroflexia bacterium]
METTHAERRTLTIPEVAVALGLARSTAYELAAADRLPVPTIRAGRRLLVSRAALERVLDGGAAPHQIRVPPTPEVS